MTKSVWSHVLALSDLTLKKAHNGQLLGTLSLHYKYLHANQIPHQLSVPSQTIPDYIRYIIGVFCFNFNRQSFLLHINTLACVKAEI